MGEKCTRCGDDLNSEPAWYNLFLHKRCFDINLAEAKQRKEKEERKEGEEW